jgi:glycosyltransferase involved in cell wall biosynthesis
MSAKSRRLVIEACNVHFGGGYTLLSELLEALKRQERNAVVFLDSRLKSEGMRPGNLDLRFINASVFGRLKHFAFFRTKTEGSRAVLFFGNVPPFFKLNKSKTYLFVQNWFLVCDLRSVRTNSFVVFFRIMFERTLLTLFIKNIDTVLVQTESMKRQVTRRFPNSRVEVRPFTAVELSKVEKRSSGYIYPARGDNAKNHRNLILAWIQLSNLGYYPLLILTLDKKAYPALASWIDEAIELHALNIINKGFVEEKVVNSYYLEGVTLIFPSFFESFGVPLVQANGLGIDIIASERDFVRDVCHPVETFDPDSHISISRAVERHLSPSEVPKCGTADDIIKDLF